MLSRNWEHGSFFLDSQNYTSILITFMNELNNIDNSIIRFYYFLFSLLSVVSSSTV